MKNFKVVVIGAGTGGLFTTSRLKEKFAPNAIAIIDPKPTHYYQPLWTLVGAGILKKEETARSMESVIPKGVHWIKDAVGEILPTQNKVVLVSGEEVSYEFLVVSPGLKLNWNKVTGLEGQVGNHNICSNYDYNTVDSTWENLKNFKGGTAVFTMPSGPFKCLGAAQKIMWLAEEIFRENKVRHKTKVVFVSPAKGIFGVPKYKETLDRLLKERNIETYFESDLCSIDPEGKTIKAIHLESGKHLELSYDMIHITPPQGPLDFVQNSPLANSAGWVDVDDFTLQHKKFPNIFSCGDSSGTPNSKTGAAIRKQAPVLTENLFSFSMGKALEQKYNGYTSCPLITGKGKCVMAEFGYNNEIMESFPFDQAQERWSMYFLKKDILPFLYWNFMIKGLM